MSETLKKLNVDAALREWPVIDNPATDWEENARAIEVGLRLNDRGRTKASISDENLWGAPLGQCTEDGHNSASPRQAAEGRPMTMPADRANDRRSLQDLAKMAQLTPPPPSVGSGVASSRMVSPSSAPNSGPASAKSEKDDSGIIDLAAASMADPSAPARAQATPLASEGLFDDDNSVRPPPLSQAPVSQAPISQAPVSQQPISQAPLSLQHALSAPSMPPASVAAPAPFAAQASIQAPKKKSSGGTVIALVVGGVVALSAAAAGTFFVMKHRTATAPVVAMTTTTAVTPAEPAPQPTTTAAAEPAPEATAEPDPANGKLALAPKGAPARPSTGAAAKPHESAPKDSKSESAKLTEKDLAPQSAGPAGALGDEMRRAVGANEQTPTPAAAATGANAATGNVPQKPSQGAVTGALGVVLPTARGCVGPDDPISRATVVFGSSGAVQTVNVSGGAVGKPAEACIKGALMKAKLPPFAEATYTAPVTIRHN